MKARFVTYVRSIVISPEFALLVAATWIAINHRNWINAVSSRIDTSTDYFEASLVAPIGICAWTLQIVWEVVFPAKDKEEWLQRYPKYYEVRIVCNVAIMYAVSFALLGIVAALKLTPGISGLPNFTLLVSVIGSFIVGLTCYLARLDINELFCECGKPKDK